MLIKIKSEDGHLHFESDGDTLSELIENFNELHVSNDYITFNYEDVDCSIQPSSDNLSCVFTMNSFSTWFGCDEVHISINPECTIVYGYYDCNCNVQVRLV